MVGKEGKLVGFEECDTLKDIASCNSRAKIDWMEKRCRSGEDHKEFLQSMIAKVRRELPSESDDDGYGSEEDDPDYKNVLNSLKECGKSYVLEDEGDGLLFAKYEDVVSSDGEFDQEPRRKLSATKENGPTTYGVNDKHMHGPKSRNSMEQAKNKKAVNPSVAAEEMEPEPDYVEFLNACKIVNDCVDYRDGEIVYCKDDEIVKPDEDIDGSSSDLEILDSDSFYKIVNSNPSEINSHMNPEDSPMRADFRRKVIAILRKPYDSKEYDELWQAINIRKPELQRKELRSGRDLLFQTGTLAKSYLQTYPDLKNQIVLSCKSKPKCLNLLRGFFYWIQNNPHAGAFKPWLDCECLSVSPASS